MKDYETGFWHALIFGIGLVTAGFFFSLIPIEFSNSIISIISLIIAFISLSLSFYFWRLSFRPIVTAMVKTFESGPQNTAFNLEISNTGTIPAKNIQLQVKHRDIKDALGEDSGKENKKKFLSCFNSERSILILHNNSKTECSFGYCSSSKSEKGFWKYESVFPITIKYQGWFGKKYLSTQQLQIIDSESFTGFTWKKTKGHGQGQASS